jgi:hypothetical protein
MLRIPCKCGKSLKVDERLVGKKVKCPACGALQVVSTGPQKATSTRDDALEKPPGREKAVKKAAQKSRWLLIGGGVAASVVLAVVAAWFLFQRGDTKATVIAQSPTPELLQEPTSPEPAALAQELKVPDNPPIAEEPKPAPPLKPPAAAPLSLRLKNIKVAWIDGQQAVNLSADCSVVGDTKPKPDADYILYVKFADTGGVKKSYRVQALSGTALNTEGKFANQRIAVGLPPTNMTSVCDVTLVEKAAGNSQDTVIDAQDNIFVSGAPPAPTPAAVAVELSHARIERLANKMIRFTVDYKFTSGQADAGKAYTLFANLQSPKASQPPAKPFDDTGKKLATQGTFTKDIAFDAPATAKFELWLTEAAGSGLKGNTVSNKLTAKMTAADPTPAKVQFQIGVPVATKMKGVNPKAPPQQFQLQFAWNLASGQLNPQATYSCVLVGQGNPLPLGTATGAQFPAANVFNQVLPYSGPSAFSIYIVEVGPDQQPRTVSNVQNFKVR